MPLEVGVYDGICVEVSAGLLVSVGSASDVAVCTAKVSSESTVGDGRGVLFAVDVLFESG